MECIFCKIIKEEIPSYTIYEDEIVKVFLDIEPMSPGHMLIIPKKHYQDLYDIDIETLNEIFCSFFKTKLSSIFSITETVGFTVSTFIEIFP